MISKDIDKRALAMDKNPIQLSTSYLAIFNNRALVNSLSACDQLIRHASKVRESRVAKWRFFSRKLMPRRSRTPRFFNANARQLSFACFSLRQDKM